MANEKKYIPIGQRLKAIRTTLYANESIKDYAEMLEVKYTRYLNWESGLNRPLPNEAESICEKTGVDMDFIYRGRLWALPQNISKALSSSPLLNATNISKDMPD